MYFELFYCVPREYMGSWSKGLTVVKIWDLLFKICISSL